MSEENFCLGENLTFEEWKLYWQNIGGFHRSCYEIFYEKIYSGKNRTFNPEGFKNVQQDFNAIFDKYYAEGFKISEPGKPGYNDFQTTLINTCSNNPQYQLEGACQESAAKICKNYTLDQILKNKDLIKLCGCQVRSLPNIPEYNQVSQACDPLCTQEQVSKNRNSLTGEIDFCLTTVCVINNVAITASNSTIGGTQFTQICPQCTSGGCVCIIDATVTDINQKIGINTETTFKQYCGGASSNGANSLCIQIDPSTQKSTVVNCTDILELNKSQEYNYPVPIWVWILCIVILIIFVLVIFGAIYIRKNYSTPNVKKK